MLVYRDLFYQIDIFSSKLQKLGVKVGAVIAVYLNSSIEAIISMLSIWKIGGVYLPIESPCPYSRINYIVKDANASVLITREDAIQDVLPIGVKTIIISLLKNCNIVRVNKMNENSVKLSDLAYIMYTSGTTGQPKGVLCLHRGLTTRLMWMRDYYKLKSTDSLLGKAPLTFDVSLWEILWTLVSGARLVVLEKEKRTDFKFIYNLILKESITHIQFVPSLFINFLNQDLDFKILPIRRIFSGGESLTTQIKRCFFKKFNDSTELHNLYAPTEVFGPLFYHYNDRNKYSRNYIGKPSLGINVYVLNDQLKRVNVNEIGEICLSGTGVANGYLNCQELTDEKFIDNPFMVDDRCNKLYKTGDLVKIAEDGNIEYIGRKDNQVKLYGNRIELEEIESVINAYSEMIRSAVVLKEINGNKFLCAYYVNSNREGMFFIEDLKNYLCNRLPDYMVPTYFIKLKKIPLTVHGKIYKKKLTAYKNYFLKKDTTDEMQMIKPLSINDFFAAFKKVVRDILGLSEEIIDDSFSFGKISSLQLMQLCTGIINIYSVNINVTDFFEFGDIKSFSNNLYNAIRRRKL